MSVVTGSLPPGFPIRTSAGHRAFAPRRSFSQLVASFVASESHRHPPCALTCFLFFFRLFKPYTSMFLLSVSHEQVRNYHVLHPPKKSRARIDDARFSLRFLSSVNLLYLCFKVANLIRVPIMSMISQLWWRITDSNR